MNKPLILSGTSNPELASRIAKNYTGAMIVGDTYHHRFPSGEVFCEIKSNVTNWSVFLIQSISKPANDNLMELILMSDAARRSGAKSITAVIPYFGYARQDKKDKPNVPISSKVVFDMLENAGVSRIITMDLHSQQSIGFTNLPVIQLEFSSILEKYINSNYDKNDVVIVAPDVGAIKRAERYSKNLMTDLAIIVKNRLGDDEVEIEKFIGNVDGKTAVVIDDLTESVGTLLQAAKICKQNGAKKVVCCVTHGCFSDVGMQRLMDDANPNPTIDEFVYSDTIKTEWISMYKSSIMVQLSVAEIFAKNIMFSFL